LGLIKKNVANEAIEYCSFASCVTYSYVSTLLIQYQIEVKYLEAAGGGGVSNCCEINLCFDRKLAIRY